MPPTIAVYNDTNAIYHANRFVTRPLGAQPTWSACLDACIQWMAQPGAKCKAVSWDGRTCTSRIDGLIDLATHTGVISAELLWPCESDDDCNLNGICNMSSGQCSCDPQWRGTDCGILNLLPAVKGEGYQRQGLNQWGGNPFLARDGQYHVLVTEMTLGCPIADYETNGQVVHAVSPTPMGPYTFNSVWKAPFATTPRVWPGLNGSLLVSYAGRQSVPPEKQRNCSAQRQAYLAVEATAPRRDAECAGMMVAESATGSLAGPWKTQLLYDPAPDEWDGKSKLGVANPSILVLENGTTLLAGRTCGREHVLVARASRWQGPFKSVMNHPAMPNPDPGDEDPFLWRDRRGYFHMLTHHQNGDANRLRNGAVSRAVPLVPRLLKLTAFYPNSFCNFPQHSYSRDGITWVWSPTIAYTTLIEWSDGSQTHFARRERPALLLDPTWRTPLALFSAVATRPYGHYGGTSYLHAQAINQVRP